MPLRGSASAPWWRGLDRYHWFVIIVAALGWLFDCLDQQLFNAARVPAMRELLHARRLRELRGLPRLGMYG